MSARAVGSGADGVPDAGEVVGVAVGNDQVRAGTDHDRDAALDAGTG
jgi:hypothetical protein